MSSLFSKLRVLCDNFVGYVKNFTNLNGAVNQQCLRPIQKQATCYSSIQNRSTCFNLNNITNLTDFGVRPVQYTICTTPVTMTRTPTTAPQLLTLVSSVPLFRTQCNSSFLRQFVRPYSKAGRSMQGSDVVSPKTEKCEPPEALKRDIPCPSMPPCLKFVRPPGAIKPLDTTTLDCGRICMPCCPPARYPPLCFFPHEQPPCKRVPNPRPAFSECKKECYTKEKDICDCCSFKPPPCRLLPDVIDDCS